MENEKTVNDELLEIEESDFAIDNPYSEENLKDIALDFDSKEEQSKTDSKSSKSNSGDITLDEDFYRKLNHLVKQVNTLSALDDDEVEKDEDGNDVPKEYTISDVESFSKLIDKKINARVSDYDKIVRNNVNLGEDNQEILQTQNIIKFLEGLNESDFSVDEDRSNQLRYQLIYRDFINKGFSEDRAKREAIRCYQSQDSVEIAKEALQDGLKYYKERVQDILDDTNRRIEEEQRREQSKFNEVKNMIFDKDKFFSKASIDDKVRSSAFDAISKPYYTDKETGRTMTALQKYQRDHQVEFLANVSLLYAATNGFRDVDSFIDKIASKNTKKKLNQIEQSINGTKRTDDGDIDIFALDTESFLSLD